MKLIPIECEIKRAADPKVFHIVTMKDGKERLVCYGRVFPFKGTKRFVRAFEKHFGTKVVNAAEFFADVKTEIKANRAARK